MIFYRYTENHRKELTSVALAHQEGGRYLKEIVY
jgi:hypothetical protein